MVTGRRARIAGIGLAHPPPVAQRAVWEGFFEEHYRGVARGLAKRVFENSGVVTRHGVANPLVEDVSRWPTSQRMQRYLAEALPLGKEALAGALADAGRVRRRHRPARGLLMHRLRHARAWTSCSPGTWACRPMPSVSSLDTWGATRRCPASAWSPTSRRCTAALPPCSASSCRALHVQPPAVDPQQVVAHALFSDAAASIVVVPQTRGYGVADVASVTDTTTADHMTWQVTDLGFRMGLSPQVPDVLAAHVSPLVGGLLARHGLAVSDVAAWAVHPGGPRVLDVVQREMGLTDGQVSVSRGVLATHGNCSSPTVLMILHELRAAERSRGDLLAGPGPVLMTAFGPGSPSTPHCSPDQVPPSAGGRVGQHGQRGRDLLDRLGAGQRGRDIPDAVTKRTAGRPGVCSRVGETRLASRPSGSARARTLLGAPARIGTSRPITTTVTPLRRQLGRSQHKIDAGAVLHQHDHGGEQRAEGDGRAGGVLEGDLGQVLGQCPRRRQGGGVAEPGDRHAAVWGGGPRSPRTG
jgi:predicted naringenin-chalcone synthase